MFQTESLLELLLQILILKQPVIKNNKQINKQRGRLSNELIWKKKKIEKKSRIEYNMLFFDNKKDGRSYKMPERHCITYRKWSNRLQFLIKTSYQEKII